MKNETYPNPLKPSEEKKGKTSKRPVDNFLT